MDTQDGIIAVNEALQALGFPAKDEVQHEVVQLSGGLTNDNVLVTFQCPVSAPSSVHGRADVHKLVIRRFCERTTRHLRYDRRSEYDNNVEAALIGLAPDVIGTVPARSQEHGGALAVRFVQGGVFDEKTGMASLCATDSGVAQLVDTVHRLHSQCTPFGNVFDVIGARRCYEKDVVSLTDRAISWPNYQLLTEMIAPIEARLRAIDERSVPCHNDMLAGNFISTPERLILIDFELSGMAPASWELGNLVSENYMDDDVEAIERLVRHYWQRRYAIPEGIDGDTPPSWLKSRVARVQAWSLVSKVSWSAWGHVLHSIKSVSHGFSYEAWSLERLDKAAKFLRDRPAVDLLMQHLHRDELDSSH